MSYPVKEHRKCGDGIHVATDGSYGGVPYFKIKDTTIDGMGQKHAYLWATCRYCGKEFNVGNVHLPK